MKYILHTSYAELCDYQWDTGKNLPLGNLVVHVPTDHIAEFFRRIDGNSYKYIVVSSNSDYGIEYQQENSVEQDMQKWLQFISCKGLRYQSLFIPSRCNPDTCLIQDKFSVKMYSWTKDTFDKIPDNVVKWYGTNINIEDDRIRRIPFGVSQEVVPYLGITPKTEFGVYCNWQENTIERHEIKQYFSHANISNVMVQGRVPVESFVSSLMKYPFIISPPGNGLDCYRTLEALYCGSLPIIPLSIWGRAYNWLPVLSTPNYALSEDQLQKIWKTWDSYSFALDNTPADLYYWENKIKRSKESLL